jgi:2-oxoglutarate ferredoxin oxidoreductase subunit gamma
MVMERKSPSRAEVLMAGLGGMGVLTAGQLLSGAALQAYKHVSYLPSYMEAMRGGLCECTVIFSDEEIASPILDQAQTVMILDGSQFKAFESRVRPGGVIIIESAGLRDEPQRKDFKLLPVSGLEIAVSMGSSVINNLILLGIYVGLIKAVPAELVEKELEERYGLREAILKQNREAFRQGLELAETVGR